MNKSQCLTSGNTPVDIPQIADRVRGRPRNNDPRSIASREAKKTATHQPNPPRVSRQQAVWDELIAQAREKQRELADAATRKLLILQEGVRAARRKERAARGRSDIPVPTPMEGLCLTRGAYRKHGESSCAGIDVNHHPPLHNSGVFTRNCKWCRALMLEREYQATCVKETRKTKCCSSGDVDTDEMRLLFQRLQNPPELLRVQTSFIIIFTFKYLRTYATTTSIVGELRCFSIWLAATTTR